MAGYISEFFGYRADDRSPIAAETAARQICPYLGKQCLKILSRDHTVAGVCAVRQKTDGSPDVICCPIRIYADNYKMLHTVAAQAFAHEYRLYAGRVAVENAKKENGAVAVFGHGWGGELRLPQRKGTGSYFVDWVLARLNGNGELEEFTAIEVQTIDTTGNYREARTALMNERKIVADTVGLNWENVSKRIIPQLIYKGQVLQREDLCKTGLFFVCPHAVYERVLNRLGGKERIPKFPTQPASIHFVSYDYLPNTKEKDGMIVPLGVIEEHCTTVYCRRRPMLAGNRRANLSITPSEDGEEATGSNGEKSGAKASLPAKPHEALMSLPSVALSSSWVKAQYQVSPSITCCTILSSIIVLRFW